jgi:hypothetical protein
MKDDNRAHGTSPSNNMLEGLSFQNQKQVSKKLKAEAYKLKRWRKQARQTEVNNK